MSSFWDGLMGKGPPKGLQGWGLPKEGSLSESLGFVGASSPAGIPQNKSLKPFFGIPHTHTLSLSLLGHPLFPSSPT